MSGGPRYEYLWADGETFKKPTPLPAPKYIEYLMDWTESQINNEKYVFLIHSFVYNSNDLSWQFFPIFENLKF